jgi:hypothetical protein
MGGEENRAGVHMWCFSPPMKHPAFANYWQFYPSKY